MLNWFDLMRQAQANAGFDALARQFNLSGDQQQKAMAAFMPAFMMGLQHAMTSADASRFLQSLMSGGYQNFWQAPGPSFFPQAQKAGSALLDQLFGSDEASRRVAHQAAAYAGIGVDTMQQILPPLAGILAGGVAQWMKAQSQMAQNFTPTEDKPQPSSVNPWAEMWGGWMRSAAPEPQPQANPFQDMMAAFLQIPPAQKPPETPQQPSASWQDMMEKGREMQMQYLTSLQSILEDAWKVDSKKS
jgi:hypothetical protein